MSFMKTLIRFITLCVFCCILPAAAQYQAPYQDNKLPLDKIKLPAGFSISSGGLITGTPAAGSAGSYSFQLTATDSSGATGFTFSLRVSSLAITGPTILPIGLRDLAYSYTLTSSGGTGRPSTEGLTISTSSPPRHSTRGGCR